MCQYCDRVANARFKQEQPELPFTSNMISHDIVKVELYRCQINQAGEPKIIVAIKNLPMKNNAIFVNIPVKFCPECGRRLREEGSL